MTIEECYQALGGNYAEVCTRLPSARLVEKFVGKFLEDKSYETLCRQIAAGDRAEAFRAAHTLKGVAGTLSMSALNRDLQLMVDDLRQDRYDRLHETFEKITAEYYSICEAIGNGE